MIPESCKKLAKHMAHYTDYNFLGQSLQLQCAIDSTDFTKKSDIEELKRKAKLVVKNLSRLIEEEPSIPYPKGYFGGKL